MVVMIKYDYLKKAKGSMERSLDAVDCHGDVGPSVYAYQALAQAAIATAETLSDILAELREQREAVLAVEERVGQVMPDLTEASMLEERPACTICPLRDSDCWELCPVLQTARAEEMRNKAAPAPEEGE